MNISPRGHEQARMLATFLRGKKMDAVYASPMKRVQQTLAPVLKNGAPPQTILPNLREVDFGGLTGLNWEPVCAKVNPTTHEWLDHTQRAAAPNRQTPPHIPPRLPPCLRN